MKTRSFICVMAAALIALSACKKETIEYTSYDPAPTVPVYPIRTVHTVAGVTDITEYTYTPQKRLATVKNGSRLNATYTYDGSRLSTIDIRTMDGATAVRNIYKYTYQEGVLVSTNRKVYTNDVLTSEFALNHSHTRGLAMETAIEGTATKTQYNFTLGNITGWNDGDGNTITYTYDTQKSIYTNALSPYPYPGDIADRFSPNNAVKATNSNGSATNYTYTYDANGYPIAMLPGQERYTFVYAAL